MVILDTNVLSVLMKEEADPCVQAWLNRQPVLSIWTTTVTIYEIQLGIELLPMGRRRQTLELSFRKLLMQAINQQILAFDNVAAEYAAALDAYRHKSGRQIDSRDTFIAGIVLAQRATLATRNVKHFADFNISLVNPWAKN